MLALYRPADAREGLVITAEARAAVKPAKEVANVKVHLVQLVFTFCGCLKGPVIHAGPPTVQRSAFLEAPGSVHGDRGAVGGDQQALEFAPGRGRFGDGSGTRAGYAQNGEATAELQGAGKGQSIAGK